MFCVLTVNHRKNTVIERLFDRIIKDDYSLVTVPVLSGAPFYHLTATVGKRGVDYERVIFEVGRCAQRLVVSEDTQLPQTRGIGGFNSDLLYKKLIHNTAEFILPKIQKDTVFDEKNGTITYCGNEIIIGEDKNDFSLLEQYNALKPRGIEKYKFAAALYELCGVFSIGDCYFNSVIVNGEKKNTESVYFS